MKDVKKGNIRPDMSELSEKKLPSPYAALPTTSRTSCSVGNLLWQKKRETLSKGMSGELLSTQTLMAAHLSYAFSLESNAEAEQPSPSCTILDRALKFFLVSHHHLAPKGHRKYMVLLVFQTEICCQVFQNNHYTSVLELLNQASVLEGKAYLEWGSCSLLLMGNH